MPAIATSALISNNAKGPHPNGLTIGRAIATSAPIASRIEAPSVRFRKTTGGRRRPNARPGTIRRRAAHRSPVVPCAARAASGPTPRGRRTGMSHSPGRRRDRRRSRNAAAVCWTRATVPSRLSPNQLIAREIGTARSAQGVDRAAAKARPAPAVPTTPTDRQMVGIDARWKPVRDPDEQPLRRQTSTLWCSPDVGRRRAADRGGDGL